ncbi:AraC family transcriptional regulator [Puteibacter caeruleilacunae]|nr:AraC family transcriptional regulator [Puteibacter caeruleilacunae]
MRRKEGFKGQRTIVLPEFIIREVQQSILGQQLFLTDIGYYPHAQFHHRIRKEGCSQYILIYCVAGEGWFSLEGKKSAIKENEFFIIPKDVAHSYGSSANDPWSIYWLHFSGELAGHFTDIIGQTTKITPSKISRIEDRIELFEEIMQNLDMGYSLDNLSYANVCLLHFLASFKYINQFRQIRTVREKDNIENTILFMKENLSSKLTLEELAEEASLSPSHYSATFRQKTGRSPMDYLIHLRIQHASQLLDHTEMKINLIASKVGYDDPYYFSRIFKQVMGMSPQLYRKQPKG